MFNKSLSLFDSRKDKRMLILILIFIFIFLLLGLSGYLAYTIINRNVNPEDTAASVNCSSICNIASYNRDIGEAQKGKQRCEADCSRQYGDCTKAYCSGPRPDGSRCADCSSGQSACMKSCADYDKAIAAAEKAKSDCQKSIDKCEAERRRAPTPRFGSEPNDWRPANPTNANTTPNLTRTPANNNTQPRPTANVGSPPTTNNNTGVQQSNPNPNPPISNDNTNNNSSGQNFTSGGTTSSGTNNSGSSSGSASSGSSGGGGGTTSSIPMPSGLTSSCDLNARKATIRWNGVSGATYAVRVDNLNNPWSGVCNSMNPGDYCVDSYPQTSYTFDFLPNATALYNVWVHAIVPGQGLSSPIALRFHCASNADPFCSSMTVTYTDEAGQAVNKTVNASTLVEQLVIQGRPAAGSTVNISTVSSQPGGNPRPGLYFIRAYQHNSNIHEGCNYYFPVTDRPYRDNEYSVSFQLPADLYNGTVKRNDDWGRRNNCDNIDFSKGVLFGAIYFVNGGWTPNSYFCYNAWHDRSPNFANAIWYYIPQEGRGQQQSLSCQNYCTMLALPRSAASPSPTTTPSQITTPVVTTPPVTTPPVTTPPVTTPPVTTPPVTTPPVTSNSSSELPNTNISSSFWIWFLLTMGIIVFLSYWYVKRREFGVDIRMRNR